ncbi:hypothetical protein Tco_0058822 [Tanacetum coccineum]
MIGNKLQELEFNKRRKITTQSPSPLMVRLWWDVVATASSAAAHSGDRPQRSLSTSIGTRGLRSHQPTPHGVAVVAWCSGLAEVKRRDGWQERVAGRVRRCWWCDGVDRDDGDVVVAAAFSREKVGVRQKNPPEKMESRRKNPPEKTFRLLAPGLTVEVPEMGGEEERRRELREYRSYTMAQVRKLSPEHLQEEFDKIQRAVAFTRGLKRDDSPMTSAFSKKLKPGDVEVDVEALSRGVPQEVEGEAPSQDVSREEVDASSHSQNIPEAQVEVPSQEATVEDLLGRKCVHTSQSTIPIKEGDPDAEHKLCIKYASDEDSASDCDTPAHLYAVVDWELLPTGLGSINAIYRLDNSRKYFTSLREILHLVTRADLMTIYGRVTTFYQDKKAKGVGLVLWGVL